MLLFKYYYYYLNFIINFSLVIITLFKNFGV